MNTNTAVAPMTKNISLEAISTITDNGALFIDDTNCVFYPERDNIGLVIDLNAASAIIKYYEFNIAYDRLKNFVAHLGRLKMCMAIASIRAEKTEKQSIRKLLDYLKYIGYQIEETVTHEDDLVPFWVHNANELNHQLMRALYESNLDHIVLVANSSPALIKTLELAKQKGIRITLITNSNRDYDKNEYNSPQILKRAVSQILDISMIRSLIEMEISSGGRAAIANFRSNRPSDIHKDDDDVDPPEND